MVWIFVPVILIVAIYVGHGQIDYWWLKKNPAPLDEPIIKWLDKFGYYYQSLKKDHQQEYRNRLSNYLFAREFMVVANKEQKPVPEDIKAIITAAKGAGSQVVLIGVPELSLLAVVAGKTGDSPIYQELGKEEGVPVIADVFSEILSRPELCADKIHPNSQGYKQMASGIYAGLKNIGLAR